MTVAENQIWPVTAAGWIALILAISSTVAVVMTWGRNVQRFEDMKKDLDELKKETTDVELLRNVLLGPLGNNGINSRVNKLETDVSSIHTRNTRIDALVERERGADAVGHEDRRALRRKEDRILRGEDPE